MRGREIVGIGVSALVCSFVSGCSGTVTPVPTSPSSVSPPQAAGPSRSGYAIGYSLNAVSLSGVVYEVTASGRVPLAGVLVYCDACGAFGHSWVTTGPDGEYGFGGDIAAGGGVWLSNAATPLHASKPGYDDPGGLPPLMMRVTDPAGWREVKVEGHTRFDIELVRR